MDQKIVKVCETNLKNKFEEVFEILNKNGFNITKKEFRLPTLSFDLRGCVAGRAYLTKNHIKLNRDIISNPKHFKEMSEETLYHELAHLIVSFLHRTGRFMTTNKVHYSKTRPKPHGIEWQKIMRLMGQKPSVTHNFEVEVVRKVERITYVCGCREHELTRIKHTKILKGALYSCRKCREFLEIKEGAVFTKK